MAGGMEMKWRHISGTIPTMIGLNIGYFIGAIVGGDWVLSGHLSIGCNTGLILINIEWLE